MGSRPSSFKKAGGGFLNNKDGLITGYQFTDAFNGRPYDPTPDPKTRRPKFHSLYCEVSAREDGAASDETVTLFVGGFDDYDVSEDGHTLTSKGGGRCDIGQNTGTAIFFGSVVEAGFPEEDLSDDLDIVNFEPVIGTRVRFMQEPFSEKELDRLKRAGKPTKRVDKNTGKEYPLTNLVVAEVLDLPTVAAKSNGKAAKPAAGKVGVKAKPASDLELLAKDTLLAVLTEVPDNVIERERLSMAITRKLLKRPTDEREKVRGIVYSEGFLAQQDGWIYNKASQVVALG